MEDRLSDALHERLTEQFVDRRGAIVSREEPDALVTSVSEAGDVVVQGLRVGRLEGFRFVPDAEVREGSRAVTAAANRALRGDVEALVSAFVASPDESFTLRAEGRVAWRGADVARLVAGDTALSPRVEPLPSELLDPPRRERVRRRVAAWMEGHVTQALGPLVALAQAAGSNPSARAVQFALTEGLGCVPRRQVRPLAQQLGPADRRWLARHGVRLGRVAVFVQDLAARDATALRALLFAVRGGGAAWIPSGPSVPIDSRVSSDACAASGYLALGPRALRADLAERVAQRASELAQAGRLEADASLASLAGSSVEEAAGILKALGYAPGAHGRFEWRRRSGSRPKAGVPS